MPQKIPGETVNFALEREGDHKVRVILQTVCESLKEKGYNPINQLVGYMISGEPAYITSHNDARKLIGKVERDEIMEVLLKNYLNL
ncbi:MAG TPA: IreB family regulatory phosphoprotein [Syntrophomonadaceae bacterium]|nr:IreB family regulatory phosphoprotein [Syntrophomonadaceae bacterium]HRX21435.1 IreB family regulatory phosphoprotein [Syntrophomonadaceae bacterium]